LPWRFSSSDFLVKIPLQRGLRLTLAKALKSFAAERVIA
jgi:hypothetical protein